MMDKGPEAGESDVLKAPRTSGPSAWAVLYGTGSASHGPLPPRPGFLRQCGLPREPPAQPGGLQLTLAALGFVRGASVVLLPSPHLAVGLHRWFSEWDPRTSSISTAWTLLEMHILRPHSRPPGSETLGRGPRCILISPPGDSVAQYSLRTTSQDRTAQPRVSGLDNNKTLSFGSGGFPDHSLHV